MTVEFDLHGLVLLRLFEAPTATVDTVKAETGLEPRPISSATADIVVRFVPNLATDRPVRRVGRTAGFSGSQFLLGPGPGRYTGIDLDQLWEDVVHLRCESGVAYIPHLVTLINLAMLRKGFLPLHASSVVVRERGIVATGWSKGGKTEAVLGIMAAGGIFVADEWCYIDPDGHRVLGMLHPIRIWDWQLRQLPAIRATLTAKQRVRLAATRWLVRVPALGTVLESTHGIYAAPEALFPADRIAPETSVDELIFVEAWDEPDIRSSPITTSEIAARMRASLHHERSDLRADADRFAFAFPDRPVTALARADAVESALIDAAFAGVPARLVSHPYPVDLAALARAVAGAVAPGAGE